MRFAHSRPKHCSRRPLGGANIADGDRVVTRWKREGHQIFADALSQFAEQSRNPRLTPIIRRISSPLRVTVLGRDGVGRGAVVAALASAGVTVTPDDSVADCSRGDRRDAQARGSGDDRAVDRPTVAVLNKADLTGFGAGGPLTLAHRHAATYRALTGVPTVPMVALLATADLDDELISALRTLVSTPADLTSTDAFVQSRHPLSARRSPASARHAGSGLGSPTPWSRSARASTPPQCRPCSAGSARPTVSSHTSRPPGPRCDIAA